MTHSPWHESLHFARHNQLKELGGAERQALAQLHRNGSQTTTMWHRQAWSSQDTPSAAESPRPLALDPESSLAHRATRGPREWSPCSGLRKPDAKKWFLKWKSGRVSRCWTTKEPVMVPQLQFGHWQTETMTATSQVIQRSKGSVAPSKGFCY